MQCWLQSVIIELNICPFAKKEFVNHKIHYSVCSNAGLEQALYQLASEFQFLDTHNETETTLLILADAFADFESFLSLIDYANQLLNELGYSGIYQLAHFHPAYCFADEDPEDASNYTSRSPFPTLHLLREKSIQRAIESHPDTSTIPQTNIDMTRKKGLKKMQALLQRCM
ncbi:hypothetical protein MNBD_GAMMA11-1729 [hydrothermal vent metagenome]|uniref:DUF1415 domain-containing protein n=1 Tax=hydrothermal vent metagenome TaxID=652676 RepID=A0A3B0XF00_9ZZZZ